MITLLLLVRATYMYGVILHAHPVRGESHNQRNTTGEVATVPIPRVFCEGWSRHNLHVLVTAPFWCDRKSRAACAGCNTTMCRCVWINSRCTSGSIRSTKRLTFKGAEIQSMPGLAQINFLKVWMKNELRNIYGSMNMITNAIATH